MKFKVKDMDIATGGPLISILNEKDAALYDLHHGDRIKIMLKGRSVLTSINIAESSKAVPQGCIGLFEEAVDALNAKKGEKATFSLERRPASVHLIKKKLDGERLSSSEIYEIVKDIVDNKLNTIELTYFVSACYTNMMSMSETVALTKAIIKTGNILKPSSKIVLDKHCIGGVAGNRTTMIVVPIIAAAGLIMPKTSSRSITSPAGTADTMEVLANVSLSFKKIKDVIKKTNACIVWGGAINLAPADDKIIKVEHPLSIDAESQLLASILAKKGAVSATHVLIDIPIGRGAKVLSKKRALELKKKFSIVGKKIGIKIKVIITDGSQPIGNGFGPALEARDVLWLLKGDYRAPQDLKKKSLRMAGLLLEMAGKAKDGYKMAEEILTSGKAYKKFKQIINAQGSKVKNDEEDIKIGKYKHDVNAERSGYVRWVDNRAVSRIARIAGAPQDNGAGIYIYVHTHQKVKKGEKLFTIYSDNKERLKYALEAYSKLDGIVVK